MGKIPQCAKANDWQKPFAAILGDSFSRPDLMTYRPTKARKSHRTAFASACASVIYASVFFAQIEGFTLLTVGVYPYNSRK